MGSRVPPAVTSTRTPREVARLRRGRSPPPPRSPRASARRPSPASPPASRPVSGPTTWTPRRRSVARLSCTAGCSHISVCMAGATSTGARVASSVAVSRSSEIPAAYLPSSFAVAGATTIRSADLSEARVRDRLGRVEQRRAGRLRRERREGERADEAQRIVGEHRHDVRAGVDELAADVDGLVRGDSAAHTEHDTPAVQRARQAWAPWRDSLVRAQASMGSVGSVPSAPSASSSTSSGSGTASILPTSISSSEIDSGLRDTEFTCGGTILPRPSPSWL